MGIRAFPLLPPSSHSLSRRARDLLSGDLGAHRDLPVDPDPEPETTLPVSNRWSRRRDLPTERRRRPPRWIADAKNSSTWPGSSTYSPRSSGRADERVPPPGRGTRGRLAVTLWLVRWHWSGVNGPALLAFVLGTNLGTRTVTGRRLLLPVVLVLVAGWFFLQDLSTTAGDARLELAGALVGVALGVAAAALMPVRRDGAGRIVTTAGVGYAVLWIAVIGGRIAFAYSATGWASRSVGEFSMTQQITGAAAWTAAFVLMALAMVLTRVAVTAAHARIITGRRVAVA